MIKQKQVKRVLIYQVLHQRTPQKIRHISRLIIDPTLPTLSNLSNDTLPTLKERDIISKSIQIDDDGKENISHLVSSNGTFDDDVFNYA